MKYLIKLKRFLKRIKLLGFKDTVIFQVAALTGYESIRAINLAGDKIYLRTGTTDFPIALSSLVDLEYGNIRCSDPSIIIDAGANIGTSAIYFAKRYPNAKIFAIEPERENYEIMLKNISKFKNIVPINAALCGSMCTRIIQNRFTGPAGYTVSETANRKVSSGQQVDGITMDSILDKYHIDRIDLLKMDIEGGEKEVLEVAETWINKVKIITAELHDKVCMGCNRAFYLATKDFKQFEKHGEKVTAYRQ